MGDYKVYLGNIPDDTRDRDVEKLFKSYGRIRNVVIKVKLFIFEYECCLAVDSVVISIYFAEERAGHLWVL